MDKKQWIPKDDYKRLTRTAKTLKDLRERQRKAVEAMALQGAGNRQIEAATKWLRSQIARQERVMEEIENRYNVDAEKHLTKA